MTKKNVKLKTRQLFDEFISNNGYSVFYEGLGYSHYVIRKPKQHERISNHNHDEILAANFDKISQQDKITDFINYALKKGEHEVALSQSIIKVPGAKNYEYDNYVNSVLNVLRPYKKVLFEFVVRPRFLENSWKIVEELFDILDSQQERCAIFEAIFQTKTFTSLDVQKNIYNLAQKYLKQPQLYDKQFNRILKVESNQNVLDSVESYSAIVLKFTAEKLVGANLNTKLDSSVLLGQIKNVMHILIADYNHELGIINAMMDYNTPLKQYSYHIICPAEKHELNKIVVDKLINDMARLGNHDEIRDFKEAFSIQKFLSECKAIHLHDTLHVGLNDGNQPKKIKNKI